MSSVTKRELTYHGLTLPVSFTQADRTSWQPGARDREVRLIVLHSAECSEVQHAAENLAAWAAGPNHPRASWHFAVDCNSVTQSVELYDIAWHAGPVNGYSIGIEQAGKASQTEEQWLDAFSHEVLERTAQLIAVVSGTYDLPIEYCDDPKAIGARGVCMHSDVTRCWKTKGGHTDPGKGYPLEHVLRRAREYQLKAVSEGK